MKTPQYRAYTFSDDGTYPNNAALPLIVLSQAFGTERAINSEIIEALFQKNDWISAWRNGLFSFHHYHSTAHEALGVYSGWVKAQLGGPGGKAITARAGDVIIIPAGVSHMNLDQSPDFLVVGAYPRDQSWDMQYGKPGERPGADRNILSVPLPTADPVYGTSGPLMQLWT